MTEKTLTPNPIDVELAKARRDWGKYVNLDEVLRRNPRGLTNKDLEAIVKRLRAERTGWINKSKKEKK